MTSPRSILGIDLRVTAVKVVEFDSKKGAITLKNWGMTEIPFALASKHPQKEDAQADSLNKLINSRGIKANDAVVVVGGSEVFVKIYALSEVSESEITKIIKWKLAEEIPFPIEEALFDYYPLHTGGNARNEYVAACINQKRYSEIDYIIRKTGLKLKAITVLPDTLFNVYRAEITKEKDKIVSLIYMGKRTTNISIFKNERLEFNRELNIGGENITLAMSGLLVSPEGRVEISPEQAEKIKVEHGIPIEVEKYPKLADNIPVSQLRAMVRPALEQIQEEIMRTFEYYKGQTGEAAINKIILTGGSSLTSNLASFLTEGLGIPVVTPSAMAGREFDEKLTDKPALEKALPRLSAAVGAALVGTEKINLMPEEVKHHFKTITNKLLKPQYILGILLGIMMITYAGFWIQADMLDREIKSMQRKINTHKPKIATLDAIEKAAKAEEKKKVLVTAYREKGTKMPLVFEEISGLIPKGAFVHVLSLTPTQLQMRGTVFGKERSAESVLSDFVLSLSASTYFTNVKLTQANKNYDYEQTAFNFEITAKIVYRR